jgi:hypothetical protein
MDDVEAEIPEDTELMPENGSADGRQDGERDDNRGKPVDEPQLGYECLHGDLLGIANRDAWAPYPQRS